MPNWTAPAGATVTRAQPIPPRPRPSQPAWCTASDVANIAGRVPCRSAHHGGVGRPGAAVLPDGAARQATGRRAPRLAAGRPGGARPPRTTGGAGPAKHPKEPREPPPMPRQAYICDAIRTPFGRYGGALSSVRTDDLGAIPI